MIDDKTFRKLAALRHQIEETGAICGDAVRAVKPSPQVAAATPFLSACADELEALAGACRQAASQAGAPHR